MNRIVYISTFIVGVLAGWLLGVLAGDSSADLHAPATDRRQIDDLAIEVAHLRGVVTQRERGLADVVVNGQDQPDLAQIEVGERELIQRRAATIAAAAAGEAVDPAWAPATERLIADGFAAADDDDTSSLRLLSATCKTTLCVVEIEHPPASDVTRHSDWPKILSLTRGLVVHHPPGSKGHLQKSVAYLARDGHSLPK